ncbi:MAG: glycine betaine ABC transporter substrate-binding protein [Candidatus Devosia phytovorans]|uniref:Glycine betaine ABC transporter substrate-binding protein n=1 Tax=Candidatus Devosia phytovorans TaxID=3121372 RepID=A0AAJ6B0N2_9HYPH|nr:glycine betaine ABC transporter substrate-binding protein [Devosia sp.]WEK04449.1 MAG: glycine betaine ABC transporter substrate-binding protein [Devosia sp.]
MVARVSGMALLLASLLFAAPALGQVTVLDQAQDAAAQAAGAPPPICGTQPIIIARMAWPSAELLAEIHARILRAEFNCEVSVAPGDLAATGSSMGSTGQPAVAPEMWVTRIADVWNAGIDAQMIRPAAATFTENQFEGWFVPDYLAAERPQLLQASGLAAALAGGALVRFISCPADWACAVVNRNLITALGLSDQVELVEPANRLEMDRMIGEVVSRHEPALFYYWQPNAVLAQFNFVPVDLGAYDPEKAKCLAQVSCPNPEASAFPEETVVIALADWVFTEAPAIAGYFQRSSIGLGEMNELMAQLSEPGATVEAVAERFVAERGDIWRSWVGTAP